MIETLTKTELETINLKGKDYNHLDEMENWHELIFWDYYGTKFYQHLDPLPFMEDWEHELVEQSGETSPRDIETIMVPILLDNNGDELEVEQVAELYNIKLTHIAGNTRWIDGDDKECFHWTMGERDEKPFLSH